MSAFLDELVAFLNKQPNDLIRVSVVCGDEDPETHEFINTNRCQDVYSCAKAFTMTAIGLLYDKGLLLPESKVCDILKKYIPESGMDQRWYDITVEMALTHSAGFPGGYLDIDVNNAMMFGRDHLGYMMTQPLVYDPGTEGRYSDGAYYLLARVAEEIAEKGMDDLLWDELFYNMKYREAAFSHCPMGHVIGATGLYIHTEELVKLGQLYLNHGVYKGKRLLSEEWTRIVSEKGYCFNRDEYSSMYSKGGMYGQNLIVIPELNRAVAVEAYGEGSGAVSEFIRNCIKK